MVYQLKYQKTLLLFVSSLILFLFANTNSFADTVNSNTVETKKETGQKKSPKKPLKKKRMAILDFSAHKASKAYARVVSNKIEHTIYKMKRFRMLGADEVHELAREKNLGPLSCNNKDCAIAIGKKLNSDYVVIGTLDQSDQYMIIIHIVDVRKKMIVITDFVGFNKGDSIVKVADDLAGRLAASIDRAIPRQVPVMLPVEKRLYLSVGGGYLLPINYLNSLTGGGYAGSFVGGVENLFFPNFFLGMRFGYGYFSGKGETNNISLVPMMITSRYSLRLFDEFYFCQEFSFGFPLVVMNKQDYNKKMLEPMISVGLIFSYRFLSSYEVHAGAHFSNIFELDNNIGFFMFEAGVGVYFW
ncbi:MAG: hypothetical protein GY754_13875 [bacterium]|nr:hypothetical protein [bacterium]